MKKKIGMLTILLIAAFIFGSGTAYAMTTELYDDQHEEYVWNELSKYSPSDAITAGIMGYFRHESQMKSNAVAGWTRRNYAVGVDDICREFTELIDNGLADGSTKDIFVKMARVHYGGFGLGQWSSISYLEHFYDFVQENGESIGDAEIQCAFIFESMAKNEKLWAEIQDLDDPYRIGRRIGYLYDGTDQLGSETIASFAKMYYRRFHEN